MHKHGSDVTDMQDISMANRLETLNLIYLRIEVKLLGKLVRLLYRCDAH